MSASAKHFKTETASRPSPRQGRWRRRLLRLLWVITVLLLCVYGGAQTPLGKGILTAAINRTLAYAGISIHIKGLSGWLPQDVRLEELVLADDEGPWLNAQGLQLAWKPTSWFRGDITIDRLAAEAITVDRRPVQADSSSQTRNLVNLPGVTVHRFQVTKLQLASPVLGKAQGLILDGHCRLAPQLEAFTGSLQITGDLAHRIEWQLQPEGSPARGHLHATLEAPQGTGHGTGRYAWAEGQLQVSDVNVVIPGADIQGNLHIDLASRLAAGKLHIQVDDAEPIAGWFGHNMRGSLQADLQLQIEDRTQRIRATWELAQAAWADLTLAQAQGNLDLYDPLVRPRGEIALSLQGLQREGQEITQLTLNLTGTGPSGQWELQSHGRHKQPFRVDTRGSWRSVAPGWAVSLDQTEGQYGAQQLQLQPDATLHIQESTAALRQWDLHVNERNLHLAGEVTLDTSKPRITGTLQLQGDVVADVSWDATVPLHRPEGQATVVVTRNDIPVSGSVTYTRSDRSLQFSQAQMRASGLNLDGQAQFDLETGLLQGHMQADISDACAVTTFLGFPVQATGRARFEFSEVQGQQHVHGTWTTEAVTWKDLHLLSHRGDMTLQGPWSQVKADLALQGRDLSWKQMQWDQWSLSMQGDPRMAEVSLLGTGTVDQPLAVDTRARIRFDGAEPVLVLQQGLVQVGATTFTLNRPALIQRYTQEPNAPPHYVLEDWQWQTEDTVLSLDGWASRDQLALQARLGECPISHLPVTGAETLSGHLRANLQVSGSLQQPCIEFHAQARDVALRDEVEDDVTQLDGQLETRLTSQGLMATVIVTTPDGDQVSAELDVPLHVSLWPPRGARAPREILFHVGADTDVRILDWLPVLREAIIEGRVVADLTFRHSLEKQSIEGHARWMNGYYEDILLGTVVQNVEAHLHGQGDTLVLEDVVARSGNQGHLTTRGQLRIAPGLPYQLEVQADRFPWIQRADVRTVASGQARLTGTVQSLSLEGTLTLDQGLLDLGALPPAAPPVLTSTRPTAPSQASTPPETITLQSNLGLDLRGGFRIYGAGLDSIWDGQLNLAKTGKQWNVTGTVSPRRGEFRLLGRPFRLTEGTIQLDGSWPIVPILDLTAIYRRSGIEARIHISGRASNPIVRITSDPPLPEDAILATVLFGRDLATITALQALQLAAAVQSLNSPGGGMDVFQRTRQAVGVDTIDIRPGENPSDSSSIAVGKYVAPEVYVEIQQPLSQGGATSTHIEYEILPNLTVETDAGSGIRPGIGINWKKDY